ncbi:MAG: hypothetical protein MK171_10030 [Pirellulales bacterium]|nr:hypothetical protein [Pirellulales bacterium]
MLKFTGLIHLLAVCLAFNCARFAQAQWYDTYQDLTSIYNKLDDLQAGYPDLVSSFSIGDSYEGRTIRGIQISGTGGTKTSRPAVLLNGTQHAREWISPMANMYAAEQLLEQYGTSNSTMEMLNEVDFYVIPVVNPDGYEYSWASPDNRFWRKNRRVTNVDIFGNESFGVDLNRNWATGWGGGGSSGDIARDTYRGTAPFSEPETQGMRDFYYSHQNLVSNIDFHSFSQLVLAPFGYSFSEQPDDGELMLAVATEMSQSIENVHGKAYVPQRATGLYQASGISIDWSYEDQGVYSYTIELRPAGPPVISSFDLPAEEILPTVEEAFAAVLDLGEFTAVIGAGDFDYDRDYSVSDLNSLTAGIVHGTSKAEYDVNGDAWIDSGDVMAWLENAGQENLPDGRSYLPGDANLDGQVNDVDFDLWSANQFASTSDWNRGDFNTDGLVNDADFAIWQESALEVPEPASLLLIVCGCLVWLSTGSRRVRRVSSATFYLLGRVSS